MTAFNNAWAFPKPDQSLISIPVLVHERPEQAIQGGAPNDHYHLTLVERNNVDTIPGNAADILILGNNVTAMGLVVAANAAILASKRRYESIYISGNAVLVASGDILVGGMNAT